MSQWTAFLFPFKQALRSLEFSSRWVSLLKLKRLGPQSVFLKGIRRVVDASTSLVCRHAPLCKRRVTALGRSLAGNLEAGSGKLQDDSTRGAAEDQPRTSHLERRKARQMSVEIAIARGTPAQGEQLLSEFQFSLGPQLPPTFSSTL